MLAPVGAISIIALAVWIADPGTTIDQQVAVENRSAPSRAQPERAAITGAEDGRRGAEADVAAAPGARPEAMPAMRRSVVTPDVAPRLESAQLAASALSNSVLVVSPEPQTRWRVGPDGSMERSIDGGATWTFQLDPTDRVIAGSAPSERVAWLVGENGLVLRTTDGAGWERTTAPVSTHLTGIEAVDALDATVDTPDGRRFRTVDGGASWVPLP